MIDEIYAKYISGSKIKSLIEDYGLVVPVSQFFKIFPPVYDGVTVCRHCGQRMYFFRPSKSSYSLSSHQRHCSCGHREWRDGVPQRGSLHCDCLECRKATLALNEARERARLEANAKRRYELLAAYQFRAPVSFESLSLREVTALYALLSCRATEDLSLILPLSTPSSGSLFSATGSASTDLLSALYKGGVLDVDAHSSSLDAFAAENPNSFYLSLVCWQPNVSISGDGKRCPLNELWPWLLDFFAYGGWNDKWSADVLGLWIELGVEECVQYLEMRLQTTKSLQFSAEEKTRAELRLLLQDYSVSQIYNFCFIAVRDAAAFLEHEYCKGAKHASNTIPGKLKSIAASYKAKEREIPSYYRDTRCPRSSLSRALFDSILQLDDDVGFKFPSAKYWREELEPKYHQQTSVSEENNAAGKHYLMCIDCLSPDVNLRFNSQRQIEMVCPDCGARSAWSALELP